jgi:hypothetical protein
MSYKTRFEAAFEAALNRLLGMRVHLFCWSVQTYPSMAAPGKTTASQEALLVITTYQCLTMFPDVEMMVFSTSDRLDLAGIIQ